jgi:ABC-2 type transport system ATP-binding protein
MTEPIIRVVNLVKEFRTPRRAPGLVGSVRTLFTREQNVVRAVDDISFEVAQGELVGYVGRNGAGKSTTIKMLTGILVPSSGEVLIDGLVPWRDRVRNALNIGVVFGQRTSLWWDLPLVESLELIKRLYRMSDAEYRRELGRVVELLELGELLRTPVRQLSLGQRMRGDLAAAILYRPRVLYLDEPTVGVDVLAKERIRTFIAEMNRTEGTTVVLTTHDLRDVERLCRRLILIEQGRVAFDGRIDELKARYSRDRQLVVDVPDHDGPLVLTGAEEIRREGPRVWLRFDPRKTPAASLVGELTSRYAVADLVIEEIDLEDVVRRIFAEQSGTRT